MKYYVIVEDTRTGPFTLEEVKRQQLAPDTLVWHKGMPDWKEACTLPELADAIVYDDSAVEPEDDFVLEEEMLEAEEPQEEMFRRRIPEEPQPEPRRFSYVPSTTPQQRTPKRKSHVKGWIAFLAVVVLLLAMLLTKPSEAEYVDAITRHTANYIVDRIDGNVFVSEHAISGTEKYKARQTVEPIVKEGLQIDDYFFYNTARVTINRHTYTVAVGWMGYIFSTNTHDLAYAVNTLLEEQRAKEQRDAANSVMSAIEDAYRRGLDAAEEMGVNREDIEQAVDSVATVAKEKANELKDKAIEKAKEKGKEAIEKAKEKGKEAVEDALNDLLN
ncbi:MAG: GYF domain-containing protein [Sodaliphilus sp.]